MNKTALPLPGTPFSATWGLIINHVYVFMNNKLIEVRMFSRRVRADACNPGSIRFKLNPGSTCFNPGCSADTAIDSRVKGLETAVFYT